MPARPQRAMCLRCAPEEFRAPLLARLIERGEPRAGHCALTPDAHMLEPRAERLPEFPLVELAEVERVDLAGGVAVHTPVRRRDDQRAVRGEDAIDPVEEPRVLADVLDDLEHDDGVEAVGLERVELERGADLEGQVRRGVVELGVAHRRLVDVDTGHVRGAVSEDRAAESLAGTEVEDAGAGHERPRPQVAVVVLVHDLDVGRPGHAALAGPVDQARCARASLHVHRAGSLLRVVPLRGPSGDTASLDIVVADAKGAVGRRGAVRRSRAVPIESRELALALGFLLAYVLVLLGHGLLPGLTTDASSRYLSEGAVQCVHDLGVGAFKPWCHEYGEPLGYPLLTNGPLIVLGALLAWLPGLTVASALTIAAAVFDALALLGAYALLRTLGARPAVALVAALAYLLSTTVIGLGGFPGTFTGFVLLPAYAFVDLWAIRVLSSGKPRLVALAVIAYVGVKSGALFMDGYSFIVANTVSALLWAGWVLMERPPRRRAVAGVALFLAANLFAVLLYRAYVPDSTYPSPLELVRAMGLDSVTLVWPTDANWLAAALGVDTDHSDLWGDGTNSAFNYAGVVCVALGVWYLARPPRSREAITLALAAAIALVLAFGPSLKVDDSTSMTNRVSYESYLMPESAATLSFPWDRAFTSISGLEEMRAAYRWFALTRLGLIVLAALAVERALRSRSRRWQAAVIVVGALAILELAPNLPDVVRQYEANHRAVDAFKSDVVPDLRAVTEPGERAFFVSYDGSHNDFLANYLATAGDVRSYNAGGDKNAVLSQEEWPPPVMGLAAAQPTGDAVVAALSSGRVDVVIVPMFHLRWSAYRWPASADEQSAARRTLVPLVDDSRLRVDQRATVSAIRLAGPADGAAPR